MIFAAPLPKPGRPHSRQVARALIRRRLFDQCRAEGNQASRWVLRALARQFQGHLLNPINRKLRTTG